MFHPAEGIERFLLIDGGGFSSAIYDNDPHSAYSLDPEGSIRHQTTRRVIIPACEIPSAQQRVDAITRLVVHSAKQVEVIKATPTATCYRLDRRLRKNGAPHGLQRVLMSVETFAKHFIGPGLDVYGQAINDRWRKTFDKLYDLEPVFVDSVPLGLVVGGGYPEDNGRLVYEFGRNLIGACVFHRTVTAVQLRI